MGFVIPRKQERPTLCSIYYPPVSSTALSIGRSFTLNFSLYTPEVWVLLLLYLLCICWVCFFFFFLSLFLVFSFVFGNFGFWVLGFDFFRYLIYFDIYLKKNSEIYVCVLRLLLSLYYLILVFLPCWLIDFWIQKQNSS